MVGARTLHPRIESGRGGLPRSRRSQSRRLTREVVRGIALELARAHDRASRARAADAALAAVDARVASALGELRASRTARGKELQEVERAHRSFRTGHAERLRARASAGRILARARDLSLADLELTREETDASSAARVVIEGEASEPGDVCIELAGLSVELAAAGRVDLAESLLAAYATEADDFELYRLIDFYERAAAVARAEASIRTASGSNREGSPELESGDLRRYLVLALATQRRPLLPRVLVVMNGLVASGKSTVARSLAQHMGAPRVIADRVRDALLGDTPNQSVHESEWERSFEPGFAARVYAGLLERADAVLDGGRPVVIDACFPDARARGAARRLARCHGIPFLLIECRVSPDVARQRIEEREASRGRGWRELAEAFAQRWQAVEELPEAEHAVLNTAEPLEVNLAELEQRLPTWPGARRRK